LVDQLAFGGRLMIPVGTHQQSIMIYDKDMEGNVTKKEVLGVRYIPLCSKEEQVGNCI
jgi:protein-L-isoaspartate(D-aspartate) O-methyltransferase